MSAQQIDGAANARVPWTTAALSGLQTERGQRLIQRFTALSQGKCKVGDTLEQLGIEGHAQGPVLLQYAQQQQGNAAGDGPTAEIGKQVLAQAKCGAQ
ncbi:hypothetical protein D3C81_2052510 [compost metagenome]